MWASSSSVGTAVSPGVSQALRSVSCRVQGSVFPTLLEPQVLTALFAQAPAGM